MYTTNYFLRTASSDTNLSYCLNNALFNVLPIHQSLLISPSTPPDRLQRFFMPKCWPEGLQKLLVKELETLSDRYFISDDSGTMMFPDGHKIIGAGSEMRCNR